VSDDPTPESRRSRCCGLPLPGLLSSGYVQSSSLSSESAVSSAADCRRPSSTGGGDCRLWESAVGLELGLGRCAACGSTVSDQSSSSSSVWSECNSDSSTVSHRQLTNCNALKMYRKKSATKTDHVLI